MVRMNKGFYLGSAILVYILVFVIIIAAIGGASRGDSNAVALLGLVYIPLIYLAVVFSVMVGKMWAAIQDGHARTTPGKAVGFLFIPFFNFYWGFQALPGFATDYNALVNRYSLNIKKLPVGLYTTYLVLCFAAFVPVVGFLAMLANMVVSVIMISKTCDAVNMLPENYRAMHPSQTETAGTVAAQQGSLAKPGLSTGAKVGIAVGIAFGLLIILGIVAAIAIPSFIRAREDARMKLKEADIQSQTTAIGTAAEEHVADFHPPAQQQEQEDVVPVDETAYIAELDEQELDVLGGIPSPDSPEPETPVRVGGNVPTPRLLESAQPKYPDTALRARIQGMVIIEILVDTDGNVKDVQVLKELPLCTEAAVEAVKQWKYEPLVVNGKAKDFKATISMNFSLQ